MNDPQPADAEDTDLTTVVAALQDQIDELRTAIAQQQRDLDTQRQQLRELQSPGQG